MPTRFASHSLRCAIALLAAWLLVLQAFLAGVATARSAALLASHALSSAASICHGAGGASAADGPPPEADKTWHFCCAFCTSATSPMVPPAALASADELQPVRNLQLQAFLRVTVSVWRGAVRAGPSQAPPMLA
jgi:hypothetical protein